MFVLLNKLFVSKKNRSNFEKKTEVVVHLKIIIEKKNIIFAWNINLLVPTRSESM